MTASATTGKPQRTTPASPAAEPIFFTAKERTGYRSRLPKSKLFVAMAGNIGVGKTTAAKIVSQAFGFELFDDIGR